MKLIKAFFSVWFWVELPGKVKYAYRVTAWATNGWYRGNKINELRREIYCRLLMLSDDFYDFSHSRKWHKGLVYGIARVIDDIALMVASSEMMKEQAKPYHPSGVCQICGCTDDDCRQCIQRTGESCAWANAEHTLCTACVTTPSSVAGAGIPSRPEESCCRLG
jgi:hypothetical protein